MSSDRRWPRGEGARLHKDNSCLFSQQFDKQKLWKWAPKSILPSPTSHRWGRWWWRSRGRRVPPPSLAPPWPRTPAPRACRRNSLSSQPTPRPIRSAYSHYLMIKRDLVFNTFLYVQEILVIFCCSEVVAIIATTLRGCIQWHICLTPGAVEAASKHCHAGEHGLVASLSGRHTRGIVPEGPTHNLQWADSIKSSVIHYICHILACLVILF